MALKHFIDSPDWSRICGIHGATFKPDDKGVLCPTDTATVTKLGETGEPFYCKHGVYSFIAWHTPYVYQFELLLNKHNKSENSDYIALPYLDLTRSPADDFRFLNDETITIFYDKKRITIENPLAHAYYYLNGIKTKTPRCGFLSPRNKSERIQIATVKKQLNNALYAGTYEQFSSYPVSKAKLGVVSLYVPLETPHNQLHNIIGGKGGIMSDVSVAAYDPIFWLHHCNMDRHYYTWTHNNTNGFKEPLYPKKMTKEVHELSCAPFFNKYIYGSDPENYNWGWKNNTLEFMRIKDVLELHRFPYMYDIIKPAPYVPPTAYVELIDIPIPRETLSIMAYLYLKTEALDKEKHFAGVSTWFGVNRAERTCPRCEVTRTNIKIDIEEYVKESGITKDTIGNYEVALVGDGALINDMSGYSSYSLRDLIGDGTFSVIVL